MPLVPPSRLDSTRCPFWFTDSPHKMVNACHTFSGDSLHKDLKLPNIQTKGQEHIPSSLLTPSGFLHVTNMKRSCCRCPQRTRVDPFGDSPRKIGNPETNWQLFVLSGHWATGVNLKIWHQSFAVKTLRVCLLLFLPNSCEGFPTTPLAIPGANWASGRRLSN